MSLHARAQTSPFDRRRKAKLLCAVLAVGLVISALVAVALVYMDRMNPRF